MENKIMARIIGVVSAKGGVGKTTLTVNLGSMLKREYKQRVLAIDANVDVPNLHLYLDMLKLPTSLKNVINEEVSIAHSTYTHRSGLDIIPGSFSEEGFSLQGFKETVDSVRDKYDIILIDTHPNVDAEVRAVMKASDELLIVTNPWLPIVMSCILTIKLAREVGVPIRGIVLNKTGRSDEELSKEEVEDSLGLPVIATIPADINVYRGVEKRTPVVVERPRSPASREYRRLAKKIVENTRT